MVNRNIDSSSALRGRSILTSALKLRVLQKKNDFAPSPIVIPKQKQQAGKTNTTASRFEDLFEEQLFMSCSVITSESEKQMNTYCASLELPPDRKQYAQKKLSPATSQRKLFVKASSITNKRL